MYTIPLLVPRCYIHLKWDFVENIHYNNEKTYYTNHQYNHLNHHIILSLQFAHKDLFGVIYLQVQAANKINCSEKNVGQIAKPLSSVQMCKNLFRLYSLLFKYADMSFNVDKRLISPPAPYHKTQSNSLEQHTCRSIKHLENKI